jgi:hypothetical protein
MPLLITVQLLKRSSSQIVGVLKTGCRANLNRSSGLTKNLKNHGADLRFVSEPRLPLNVPVRRADRPGMIDLELEIVSENPSWIAVLKAYQKAQEELAERQAEEAAKSAQAEKSATEADASMGSEVAVADAGAAQSDESETADEVEKTATAPKKRASRWVQRITHVATIETAELSKIHGRLIAYDLLKCDLAGRSDGMVYQLTSSGKTILSRFSDEPSDVDDRSAA